MTDPRHTDPLFSDPVLKEKPDSSVWGWIAGLAILSLIVFVVIAGWYSDQKSKKVTVPVSLGVCTIGPLGESTGAVFFLVCNGKQYIYTLKR